MFYFCQTLVGLPRFWYLRLKLYHSKIINSVLSQNFILGLANIWLSFSSFCQLTNIKATNLGFISQLGWGSQRSFCKANQVKCHSTETTASTAGTSDGNYIDREAQLVRNMDNHSVGESLHVQAPDKATEGEEDEPIASLSRSSSSEGIWPSSDAVERGYLRRTSTIGIPLCVNLSVNMGKHMTYHCSLQRALVSL